MKHTPQFPSNLVMSNDPYESRTSPKNAHDDKKSRAKKHIK